MSSKPLSRRTFVAGGTLTVAGGAALLAGCGGDDDPGSAATGGTPATDAGEPTRGGTIVYAASSEPSGFDPARWWSNIPWNGAMAVFDRLLTITAEGTVAPELLAAAPEINADGTLYTFKLRSGVKFHHGRDLTADDVKFSLERLVDPATGSEGGGLYTGLTIPGMADVTSEKEKTLSGIKVVDPSSFTIELEQPDSVLLFLLGLPFASIVPRDVVEDLGLKKFNFAPVGSGPFTMTDVDPSKGLVLERNDAYWDPERPYVDRVEWTFGIDPELQSLRIQSGEQDLSEEDVPTGSLDAIRNDAAMKDQLYIQTENNVLYNTLSIEHEAMADPRVRQAIAMCFDKERLVRTLKGLGEVANGGLFSPESPYFQDGLAHPFDPEQAKALLAEAGYADGFEIEYYGTNFTPYKEIGEVSQQDLQSIGIKVDLRADVREKWLAEIVKNPPAITQNQWDLPYPHGSYVMDSAFTKAGLDSGCCNFSSYTSDEFEQLVKDAHATTDDAERVELYKRMDEIAVKEETLWVPLFYPKRAFLTSKKLKGYSVPPSPNAQTKLFADYWIA